ncbi:MAG: LytTR family DNA-binding domain-containing protein [Coriobacteriales bacterium]|nr:LytTR family DNA-binding domain-containing protein [Coriobacteriales bacterium]
MIDAAPSKLRIAVLEDTEPDARTLLGHIADTGMDVEIERFSNGEDFLKVFSSGAFDLIFLDIYMEELSGVETAEHIRAVDSRTTIVFTTTSEDFTREGYRLNAYKYMLKPIEKEDVVESLELAAVKRDRVRQTSLDIISKGEFVSIPYSDIEYVESRYSRSIVVVQSGEEYPTSISLDSLENLLKPPRFLRSHRAFIVNLDHVDDVDEDFIMDNGAVAYIRVKDHKRIKNAYDDYIFNSTRGDLDI